MLNMFNSFSRDYVKVKYIKNSKIIASLNLI